MLVSRVATSFETMPKDAVVGTASLRRQAQVLRLRPDLKVVPMRGNVGTRLEKLARGEADATILALAGLKASRRGRCSDRHSVRRSVSSRGRAGRHRDRDAHRRYCHA